MAEQQQQQLTPGGGGAAAVVPAPKVPGGPGFEPSVDQVQQFQRDGVLVVRRLFTTEEVGLVRNIAKASEPESVIWLSADTHKEDVYNGICHSRRVVSTLSALLDDEVYLYHYKMIMKEAQFAAGSEEDRGNHWVWHQDYGYWYKNNAVNPNMGSCMIALDRATRDNGCLQVLKGSCRLGRLDHGPVVDGRRLGAAGESESEGEAGVAEQHGADPERVELAQAAGCERLHCELEPGDAIFFHANTLHRSDELRPGADPRWALICCYNTKHNLVDDNPGHPSFRQLPIWEDGRVLELGQEQWSAMQAGTWDDSLSEYAQLELEQARDKHRENTQKMPFSPAKQRSKGATTLTAGQMRALSKAVRAEGEPGYEAGAPRKPKL